MTGPNWSGLTDGYREFHDPRPLMARLKRSGSLSSCWSEIWERMHHQGDVGTASYAIVPTLVEAHAKRPRSADIYAYVALLEECREERRNPEMPDWLEDDYECALVRLRELAFEDLRGRQPAGRLAAILSFLAAQAGCLGVSVAVGNLGMSEYAMNALAQYGESLDDI